MSKLRWTARAQRDLVEIGQFIASDDPEAALAWIAMLRKRARAVSAMPRSGRRVPELDRDDVREVVVKGYRIVYRVEQNGIAVLTVFESHRLFATDDGE